MTTITIPTQLTKEKDLILVPRRQYENLVRRSRMGEKYEDLWKNAAKDHFSKSYSKADAIYDQI